MTRAVPVLMYHAVSDHPAPAAAAHAVTPAAFADQLARLHAAGYTTLTASAAARLLAGQGTWPQRPVALTFDDGYADLHHTAWPLLQRYGFTATVFVTTGWLADAADRAGTPPLDRMLSWSQLGELAAAGVEVGAHSHSHPQLDQLPDRPLQLEVTRCKERLEERLGLPVTAFAYPYGYSSARVRRVIARAGYASAFAVANALARPGADPLALPRLTVSNRTRRFADVVGGRRIGLLYARERTLTKGYALARHARRTATALARRATTRG
jgi:peptidoglycan/xylan/chitin deacetylase (PgdA/CDA1 family)